MPPRRLVAAQMSYLMRSFEHQLRCREPRRCKPRRRCTIRSLELFQPNQIAKSYEPSSFAFVAFVERYSKEDRASPSARGSFTISNTLDRLGLSHWRVVAVDLRVQVDGFCDRINVQCITIAKAETLYEGG